MLGEGEGGVGKALLVGCGFGAFEALKEGNRVSSRYRVTKIPEQRVYVVR